MVKRFTKEELNKVIKNYLTALNGKITLQKAVLFGSYAKGLAHDYSDIDLLIISDELPKNKLKTTNGYFLDQLVGNVDPSLEVIGVHPDNLSDPVSKNFFEEIFRTGQVFYDVSYRPQN
jgi:predicted nucleotidyltransferase